MFGARNFKNEGYKCFIELTVHYPCSEKVMEHHLYRRLEDVPKLFEEFYSETVRPRCFIIPQILYALENFIVGKRASK